MWHKKYVIITNYVSDKGDQIISSLFFYSCSLIETNLQKVCHNCRQKNLSKVELLDKTLACDTKPWIWGTNQIVKIIYFNIYHNFIDHRHQLNVHFFQDQQKG